MPRAYQLPAALLCAAFVLGAAREAAAADTAGDASPIVTGDVPVPFAFNYGEFETTRAAAFGGAMAAAGNGTTAPFYNPAGMTLTRVYHIEAIGQGSIEFGRQAYGGVVVDSITSKLAGGIAVNGGFLDSGEPATSLDRSYLDVRLALAYPFSDQFSIGIGGRYMKVTENGLGPLGDSKASGGLRDPEDPAGRFALMNIPTFDAGVTLKLAELVVIGISGQNLTYPNNGMMPTTIRGGIAIAHPDFTIEADGLADFTSYGTPTARLSVGGEYLLINHIPLRAGYRFDQGASSHAVSGGVGYTSNEFMIEGSVRRTVAGPEATSLFFGAAYFLESSGLTGRGDEP